MPQPSSRLMGPLLITPLPMLAVLLSAAVLHGCGPVSFVVGVTPGDQELETETVIDDGRWGSDRVALIDVTGLLINAERPALLRRGENPVSVLQEKLDKAASDPRVKAVVLRLNTPGGTVTASDVMYRQVTRFRRQTGKPVVALMMDVAASGGYYLACSADEIVAYPTTVTGSIGVILQTVSVRPALVRLGVQPEALTSGPNKDAGSPLSDLEPGHRAVLQRLVDQFAARFVAVVREARPGVPADRLTEVTDGRVVSGEDAARIGLVDHLGDLHEAFDRAKAAAGLDRADLVIYRRPLDYVGSAYAGGAAEAPVAAGSTQINLAQINLGDAGLTGAGSGFYYLWAPGLD